MAMKCHACGKFMSAVDELSCPKCEKSYHKCCVNIAKDAQIDAAWTCPECTRYRLTKNTDGTPLRGSAVSYSAVDKSMDLDLTTTSVPDATETTAQTSESELAKELRRFTDEMQQMREAFLLLRKEVEQMRVSLTACGGRLEELEARVEALERRGEDEGVAKMVARVESLERRGEDEGVAKVIAGLETTVAQLKIDIQDREQEQLQNDADISNVPETSGENVMHLVLACAAKVGVRLEERDVVSCSRVGPLRAGTEAAAGDAGDAGSPGRSAPSRPRPIAVRLARQALREDLLQAARVRRAPDTQGIGLSGEPHRFYINERLTYYNRRLFYMARETAKEQKWRYVWTKNGRIYIRQAQGDKAHRLRSETDLETIFGTNYIRATR